MNECINGEINRWLDGDLIISFHGISFQYISNRKKKCILQTLFPFETEE